MSRSKALWIEEKLAPEMEGKVYEHLWMTMIGHKHSVGLDYYMVESGEVYLINNGTKQRTEDSLETTNLECICIGDYDPNKIYERKLVYYSKEDIKELFFNHSTKAIKMNIIEAINKLDDTFDENGYGKIVIHSNIRNLFLINSQYGINKCGHDWPTSYNPSKADFLAEDWEISK